MAKRLAVVCSYFGTDWADGGGMQKNLYSFLKAKRKGVDLIDVSSGALVPYQNSCST
jgi:hypothetical protein